MYHGTAQKIPCIWAIPWYSTQIPGSLQECPKNVSRYSTEAPVYMPENVSRYITGDPVHMPENVSWYIKGDPMHMGQTLVHNTDPRSAPGARCTLPLGVLRL